jgi:hypothetical protein
MRGRAIYARAGDLYQGWAIYARARSSSTSPAPAFLAQMSRCDLHARMRRDENRAHRARCDRIVDGAIINVYRPAQVAGGNAHGHPPERVGALPLGHLRSRARTRSR